MVEYVEAKIVAAKPAYARFVHPLFGWVEVELVPLRAVAIRLGEGYRFDLVMFHRAFAEKRAYKAQLCAPQLLNEPVEVAEAERGHVVVDLGHKTATVEFEIVRVFTSSVTSDIDGNPCVAVTWLHGVRL